MNKITTFTLICMLLVSTGSCSSVDKTSSNAPDPTTNASASPGTGSSASSPSTSASASPSPGTTKTNQDDATSKVRRDQLNSDIRSREQRNNVSGGDTDRANSDLSSEVRSKLEANIPKGSLAVAAKDGAVVVSGTVTTKEQLAKIEPLTKQIKGVKSVKVDAKVAAAK